MNSNDPLSLARAGEAIEAHAYVSMINLAPARIRKEHSCVIRRIGSASFFSIPDVEWMTPNRLMGFGIFEPGTEEALSEVVSICEKMRIPKFYVALCACALPDAKLIAGWLTARGFRWHNDWVKMYAKSADVLAERETPNHLNVRAIDADEAGDFARIVTTSFGYPDSYTQWLTRPVGRPGWHHFLAFDQSKPVATGALFIEGDVGNLLLGSTLQSHRRLGAQSELLRARLRCGIDAGCKLFFSETHTETAGKPNPSLHNMKRLGFEEAYLRPNYVLSRVQ